MNIWLSNKLLYPSIYLFIHFE